MSKSRGNVVNHDDNVSKYGADTVRAFLMFIGPWNEGGPWNPSAIEGVQRFLNRVWSLVVDEPRAQSQGQPNDRQIRDLRRATHQTLMKVTSDYDNFKFNTMIAALMSFSNTLTAVKETPVYGSEAWDDAIETLLLMMAPAMPHISEELWARLGKPYSIHLQSWPQADPELAREDEVEIAIQVNGKVRDRINVPADADKETLEKLALASERAQKWIDDKPIRKVIVVPGRLVNIIAR
jgi:leucyl-tRNA synthetase